MVSPLSKGVPGISYDNNDKPVYRQPKPLNVMTTIKEGSIQIKIARCESPELPDQKQDISEK